MAPRLYSRNVQKNSAVTVFKEILKLQMLRFRINEMIYLYLKLRAKVKYNSMSVTTLTPIARESADHRHPVGAINDNYANEAFVNKLFKMYPSIQSFLDIGCAGGQLVINLVKKGIIAIGVEGSSTVLLGNGRENWMKNFGKSLFFADITKPFAIQKEGEQYFFDLIHAEEVFEHLSVQEAKDTIANIKRVMTVSSILLLGISAREDCRMTRNDKLVILHKTVKPAEWWVGFFRDNGLATLSVSETRLDNWGWPLLNSNRSQIPDSMFFGLKLVID